MLDFVLLQEPLPLDRIMVQNHKAELHQVCYQQSGPYQVVKVVIRLRLQPHPFPERGVTSHSSFVFKATGTATAHSEEDLNRGVYGHAYAHDLSGVLSKKLHRHVFGTSETY